MRVAVHPRLVEEAVFLAGRAREAAGDPLPGRALRRALERGYRLPPGPERDRRFERAHAAALGRLGLARALAAVFEAHPALGAAEGPVRVGPAAGRAKEGVDLHQRTVADGRAVRAVVASVLPGTLADPAALAARLHRHAAKVADLLDPAFGWRREEPEPSPARRETVRLRYGAAWDAWTDGRLARRGLPAPVPAEKGEEEFAAAFAGTLGAEGAAAAFRGLREDRRVSHDDLLRMARNPAAAFGSSSSGIESAAEPGPRFHPGSACPGCRFPTHDWVPDPAGLPENVLAAIRSSLTGWTPGDGLCGQCGLLFGSRLPAAAPAV